MEDNINAHVDAQPADTPAVNAITNDIHHVAEAAIPTTYAAAAPSVPPASYETNGGSGIAPGDGDLMPPRFSGDGSTDASRQCSIASTLER